jgi:hypothetical protein
MKLRSRSKGVCDDSSTECSEREVAECRPCVKKKQMVEPRAPNGELWQADPTNPEQKIKFGFESEGCGWVVYFDITP